jgi:amino acid transporter
MLYGTGSMLGAGIYALVGTAAGELGNAVWLAFVVAMIAAALTGMSYACLGSRYPRAAGAAYATHRAYRKNMLTYIVGLAVVASGMTSMATGARAIGAELSKMGLAIPKSLGETLSTASPEIIGTLYLIVLSAIVFRGIRESMALNAFCTIVEVAGLLLVIAIGIRFWGSVNYLQGPPMEDGSGFKSVAFPMILSGAVLTFFSFIGFEDVLNVAEETKNPRRDIPIGLLGAMLIATVIYLAVAITAVSVGLPHADLVKGGLRAVVGKAAPWFPPNVFSVITIFAIANTALLNYVMGTRLLYGMADNGLLPPALGKVHPTRQTPHVATFFLLMMVVALLLVGHIGELASSTTLLLLTVFTVVNGALVILKFRPSEPKGGFEVPVIVPMLGVLVCGTLVVFRVVHPPAGSENAVWIAGGLIAWIAVLYLILRPKAVVED